MEVTRPAPGAFSWIELFTTDKEAAKKFYGALFGWSPQATPIGDGQTYTMFELRGKKTAATFEMGPRMPGTPPHWAVYVTGDDLEGAARRAKELGGELLAEPFDVLDVGRMAVVKDPVGAIVNLWLPRKSIGAELVEEPGAFTWMELAAKDAKRARGFYTELFGWKAETMPMGDFEYTVFTNGDRQVGGMMEMTAEWGDIPSHWMTYIQVENVDASAKKAEELGANLMVPPTDIPGVGRFTLFRDPQGAHLSMLQMA